MPQPLPIGKPGSPRCGMETTKNGVLYEAFEISSILLHDLYARPFSSLDSMVRILVIPPCWLLEIPSLMTQTCVQYRLVRPFNSERDRKST